MTGRAKHWRRDVGGACNLRGGKASPLQAALHPFRPPSRRRLLQVGGIGLLGLGLQDVLRASRNSHPQEIVTAVVEAVETFAAGAPMADDLTLVAVKLA